MCGDCCLPSQDLSNFADWKRADQIAYLNSTYGSVEGRQREAGGNNVLSSARFRANNVANADYVSPEERALWAQVKPDGGTFLGNFLHDAAPGALALGLVLAGGSALTNGGGIGSGLVQSTASGAGTAATAGTSGMGIFANGGLGGMAGVGGGSAGALAAGGGIAGGAGAGAGMGLLSSLVKGGDWANLASSLVSAGTGLLGAKKQSKAAEKAAKLQMDQFNILNGQQQPYIQSGYGALSKLNSLLGIGMPQGGYGGQPQPQQSGGNSMALRIKQLLALRAANGDTEAARIAGGG